MRRFIYLFFGFLFFFISSEPNSPHPAVRFAVGGIDADGSLAVARRLRVVAHFAVSGGPACTRTHAHML